MFGLARARASALLVGAGIESRSTGSTESPERAAQAAAGIAYSASLARDEHHVVGRACPRAAEKKRSIAAARS